MRPGELSDEVRSLAGLTPREIAESDASLDAKLEAILSPPCDVPPPGATTPTPLDGILASRSHVRLLRALVRYGDRENLSASEAGRRAGVSHPRALDVVAELAELGIVRVYRAPGYSLVAVETRHVLADAIARLFEAEREVTRAGEVDTMPG